MSFNINKTKNIKFLLVIFIILLLLFIVYIFLGKKTREGNTTMTNPNPANPVPKPETPVPKPAKPVPKPEKPVPKHEKPVPKPEKPVPKSPRQYQQRQYQQRQYQQPQYQQRQYQQRQYQLPQYKLPQYQQQQYQQQQYQQQQYQQQQYQQQQYKQPPYQQPQYQLPQYQLPQYQLPQYQEQTNYKNDVNEVKGTPSATKKKICYAPYKNEEDCENAGYTWDNDKEKCKKSNMESAFKELKELRSKVKSLLNSNKNNDSNIGNDNKYILKSQIVPPVCPACPSYKCGVSEPKKLDNSLLNDATNNDLLNANNMILNERNFAKNMKPKNEFNKIPMPLLADFSQFM
jgi:hypothetical protein